MMTSRHSSQDGTELIFLASLIVVDVFALNALNFMQKKYRIIS